MRIKVRLPDGKIKSIIVKDYSCARDIALQLKINPEMILVKKGDMIIPDAEKLNKGDSIELLKVVSGG